MKKLTLILVAAMLLFNIGAASLATEQEMIDHLVGVVEEALKAGGYDYTYDPEYECFELEFSLQSTVKSTDVTIYVYDDMISVSAEFPLALANEHRDRMAVFLTLINSEIYYAQFRMDYETAQITCRSAQIIESVIPGSEEIFTLVEMPVFYMNRFGDAIARVALGGDPFGAFAPFE